MRYIIRLTENEKRGRKAIIENSGFLEFGTDELLIAVPMIVCKVDIRFKLSFTLRWLPGISDNPESFDCNK